ncbi:phage terminase large subunit [Paludisphaera soli]|uniref:phage terminase large subunit n=1 Tax=Paludisphaera soli TaxID=2712865 RepID=UPI0013EBD7EF|nr:phage terminase large subunit [Paludisphaera soli]
MRVDTRLGLGLIRGTLSRDLLVCGPAGTGKTYSILVVLHKLARKYPGLRILICREVRASLAQSVLVTFEQEVLVRDVMSRLAQGASRRTRQSYIYPNGSEIAVAGLDKPTKALSSAWDVIYVNEAIETTEEAWETLQTRLGRPGRPTRLGYLIGDTNPGDPSHWLRKRADAGLTKLWDTTFEANPAMHDGIGWTPAGLSYVATLDRLTGSRKKRLRYGLWAAGEGAWFDGFDPDKHVANGDPSLAEYDPDHPVYVGLDSGNESAAVWFQVRPPGIVVFADYYSKGRGAYGVALDVIEASDRFCGGRVDSISTDPAGRSATSIGPTVFGEYERAGLGVHPWPTRSILDSLSLLESFISIDPPELLIHPRCQALINAFANYKRAQRQRQWVDKPVDPQHPYEDLIDALRGGLCDKFPEGRKPEPLLPRVDARRLR